MKYHLAEGGSERELCEEVQAYLDNGYKLQGGVSVTCYHIRYEDGCETQYWYAQALIKEEKCQNS